MGSKIVFQVFWAVVAAYSFYRFSICFEAIRNAGRFPPGPARLRILGLNGGAELASMSPSLFAAAGLLRDGCKLPGPRGVATEAALSINSKGAVPLGNSSGDANGYYFMLNVSDLAISPVSWVVEVSSDDGSTWDVVFTSVWRLANDGSLLLFPGLAFSMPFQTAFGTEMQMDCRAPLSWVLATATDHLIFALFFLFAAAAGWLGRVDLIAPMWATALIVDALFIVSGISIAEPWMWRESVRLAFLVIGNMILALSAMREKHFISIFAFVSIFVFASALGTEVGLCGREPEVVLLEQVT